MLAELHSLRGDRELVAKQGIQGVSVHGGLDLTFLVKLSPTKLIWKINLTISAVIFSVIPQIFRYFITNDLVNPLPNKKGLTANYLVMFIVTSTTIYT